MSTAVDPKRHVLLRGALSSLPLLLAGCGGGIEVSFGFPIEDFVPAPGGSHIALAPSGTVFTDVDGGVYEISGDQATLLDFTVMSSATRNGQVSGLAVDNAANLYVASWAFTVSLTMNLVADPRITRISPGGVSTRMPIDFGSDAPNAITIAADGSLLAALGHGAGDRIVRVYPDGTLVEFAPAVPGWNYRGIVADPAGNVFATTGNAVVKIAPGQTASVLAGDVQEPGSADGTGAAARFNSPFGITRDVGGNLYVADAGNRVVRRISPGASVSTIAGLAGASPARSDGWGSAARFVDPAGIAIDASGTLWVSEPGNPGLGDIRTISPAGAVDTVAVWPF